MLQHGCLTQMDYVLRIQSICTWSEERKCGRVGGWEDREGERGRRGRKGKGNERKKEGGREGKKVGIKRGDRKQRK